MKTTMTICAITALAVVSATAAIAQEARDQPLLPNHWYAYRKNAPNTAGCKNPSFVSQANRILRDNLPDPHEEFKQNGCTPDWLTYPVSDPLRFKFKAIRSYSIDGKTIIETMRQQYYPTLHKILGYTLFIDQADVDPLTLPAPTIAELKAEAAKVFGPETNYSQ